MLSLRRSKQTNVNNLPRVTSLSNTLRNLDDLLQSGYLEDQQQSELNDNAKACSSVLQDLDAVLDKYRILLDEGSKLRTRVQITWKRLQFEPGDVKDLRARLTSNVGLLNAFYGNLSR